jgi:hypothetical protein
MKLSCIVRLFIIFTVAVFDVFGDLFVMSRLRARLRAN